MQKISLIKLLFVATLCFTTLGCDSGSNDDDDDLGASFEQMADMVETTFGVFGEVAAEIFISSVSKNQPIYSCDTGQVDYTQSPVNQDLYELEFQNCNGINGNVDLGLDVEVGTNSFSFDLLLDGSLEESCTLQFANFTESVSGSLEGDDQTITLSGSISANCSGERFSCSFNNDELSEDTEDTLFQDNCRATGI